MEITNTLQKKIDLALGGASTAGFPDVLELPKMFGMVLVKQGTDEEQKRPETSKVTVFVIMDVMYVLCHR